MIRFENLSTRPFHADEATGARITSSRMESGNYNFDPLHYHGPTLSSLAQTLCRWNGESTWQEMNKTLPRVITAIAGSLLLLIPIFWRKLYGDAPMLLASALIATSPLLVYYSRMFIHESLLVLFGMLFLIALTRFPRHGIPGILIGLMFATKESFAISVLAWTGAVALLVFENRKQITREKIIIAWQISGMPIAASLITATLVSLYCYTDGFRQMHGAVDAIRTFFVYKTVDGHHKPFLYYIHLLAIPFKSGGYWWFGSPVILLALLGYITSYRTTETKRFFIRFLSYAALGHFLIYSLIAYKTPWLACLPWAHVCLLAGFALINFSQQARWLQITCGLFIAVSLFSQFQQTRRATGRLASDDRNPFAYVPTRNSIENLTPWLKQLEAIAPDKTLEPIAVVGSNYWPMPWYLRHFSKIGYWPSPVPSLQELPLVFAMPEMDDLVTQQLQETHTPLPQGLRAGVAMTLFVRNDLWNQWMTHSP